MDDPPPYSEASGGASGKSSGAPQSSSYHPARNGIPPEHRRSMEDESRPLPPGWVRQYDAESQHQFFVDTNSNPHRSIWWHPLDDDTYLNSLDPAERQRQVRLHRSVSLADIEAESSDDDEHGHHHHHAAPAGAASHDPELPPRPEEKPKGLKKFGRKLKDKVTDSTHEERERQREVRAEQEKAAYERHLKVRQAFTRAMETGQPQLVGKDKDGKDVYIEPPNGPGVPGNAYGYDPYGYGSGPYGSGSYANQNARYIRPQQPYYRPYGYGYGGGYGFPLLGGGLLGGALLGAALF